MGVLSSERDHPCSSQMICTTQLPVAVIQGMRCIAALQAIMGMKVICFELDGLMREMDAQPLSSAKASLLASTADQLVSNLTFFLHEVPTSQPWQHLAYPL